ncbi:hypothetical protein Tco_1235830 [Tanacetum coccineum]
MKIGKEDRASVIFDNWCNIGVLQNILTYRDMYNARIKPDIVVKDILCNGMCNWPRQWLDKYPELSLCNDMRLDDNKEDELVWKSRKGKEGKYTVRQAYDDLRRDYDEDLAKEKMGTQFPKMEWNDLVNIMAGLYNGNAIGSIIRRLGFAASVYLIWQERNNIIFKDVKRSPKELAESIYDTVRMRLMSLKVKMSKAVLLEAQVRWNVSWQSVWKSSKECLMLLIGSKLQMLLSCFMVPLKNVLQYGMMKDRIGASMALFCLVRDVLARFPLLSEVLIHWKIINGNGYITPFPVVALQGFFCGVLIFVE